MDEIKNIQSKIPILYCGQGQYISSSKHHIDMETKINQLKFKILSFPRGLLSDNSHVHVMFFLTINWDKKEHIDIQLCMPCLYFSYIQYVLSTFE